jgi:RND family efflux transporter MFP subunit
VIQANADTARSRATVGQSIADVAKSQAGVAQSQAELVRQKAAIKQAQAALAGAKAKLAQAQAAQSGAEAKLAQSRHGVDTQKASLAQANSQYELAQVTARRYEALLKEGFVAQQDYDQAAATLKTTAATVQAAEANVQASQSDVSAAEQDVAADAALVDAARSDQDAAQANVAAAVASYRSLETNVAASKATVQASQADVAANQAAVSSSEANARRYEVLRSFEKVVAPFDGVITARNVDLGSLVSPGTITATNSTTPSVGLFGIARTDTLRIFVNLPQTYYQSVKTGSKAKVLVRELPSTPFVGTVYRSSGALDAGSRTLLTEVRLPNPGNVLLPGMYAQVQLPTGTGHPTLRVPAAVLQIDASGTRVAVVDAQQHVHFRDVTLGRDFGTEVEVMTGVQPGDHLVANPSDTLKDGIKVRTVAGGGDQ